MKAPLKSSLTLTREMKLILVLLLMVALIGGWFVLTNRSTPEPTAVTPTTPPESGQPASGTAGQAQESGNQGQTGTSAGGAATAPATLATGGQIEVATLPPFPVPEATTEAAATPTPGGINPDQSLLTLGTSNPFRPLQLAPVEGAAQGGAPAGSQATQATGQISAPEQTTPVARVPVQEASTQVTPVQVTPTRTTEAVANPVGGAVPITRLPGTGSGNAGGSSTGNARTGSVVARVTPISGGALPTVTIPGAGTGNRPAATAGGATGTATSAASPLASTAAETQAAEPVVPPIVGVTAPRETTATPSTVTAPATQNGAGQNGGAPSQTAGQAQTGGQGQTAAAATPQVITQLNQGGQTGAATGTPATTLDRVLTERRINLDGAVLGPVNTAVFRTSSGFVVVSVGQTLPETDVVLREVTATSATLALGNTIKTLQLEQR